ncbi:TIM barrel protein [bacterium]|nr:TIM barrel protein [bacterium]
MPKIKAFDKLNFLTAGMPSTTKGSYKEAFDILSDMQLDGMEFEFVHGVRISDESRQLSNKIRQERNFTLTAHCPFYINLNSQEEEKVEASVNRIIETAQAARDIGAFSITYHAAFYMGKDKETVYNQVKKTNEIIGQALKSSGIDVWVRPETTGKSTQWGDLYEVIRLSKEFDFVLPCIDFSHLHARSAGEYNTYDEFSMIFEKLGKELGDTALKSFHGHLAGIKYTDKGERNHLNLDESDMNYKDLLKAFKAFDVRGALTCESPNIEIDTKILKDYYLSL